MYNIIQKHKILRHKFNKRSASHPHKNYKHYSEKLKTQIINNIVCSKLGALYGQDVSSPQIYQQVHHNNNQNVGRLLKNYMNIRKTQNRQNIFFKEKTKLENLQYLTLKLPVIKTTWYGREIVITQNRESRSKTLIQSLIFDKVT